MLYPLSYGGPERVGPMATPADGERLTGAIGNTGHTRLVTQR